MVALAISMVEVLGWGERTNLATIGSVVRILRDAGLNQEDRQKQTVGYYEGLLNEGSRVARWESADGPDKPAAGFRDPEHPCPASAR